jgi:hypothetical protein
MRLRTLPLALLLFVLLALAAGCYTVMRHPTGPEVVHAGDDYKSCADCHAESSYYHPYYGYARSHYWWNGFYGYPWWYYDCWWWYWCDTPGGGGSPAETGSRHLWQTSGLASSGWGFATGGTRGSQVTPPVAQPPRSSVKDETRKTPERSSQKDPERSKEKSSQKDPDRSKEQRSTPRRDTSHLWRGRKRGS